MSDAKEDEDDLRDKSHKNQVNRGRAYLTLKLVALLNDGGFPHWHGFRRRDGLSGRDFVGEHLLHAAALLLGHLVVTGVEVLLALLEALLQEGRVAAHGARTAEAHVLAVLGLHFGLLLLFQLANRLLLLLSFSSLLGWGLFDSFICAFLGAHGGDYWLPKLS